MTTPPTPDVRYGQIDLDYATTLASTPAEADGPVWMINLMKYRERADYGSDTTGAAADISGREADDRYAPLESIAGVGAEIVFLAEVETQLIGAPVWDRVAIVKYPTRRAFIEMQARPDFQAKHVHKDAGMERTIILGGQPLETPGLPADAPDWQDVPHPPTAEDGPVVVCHVLRYQDDQDDRDHMVDYQNAAGQVAVPQGVRIPAWFTIEGTIIGDGRPWHQARFNAFPSRRAFEAILFDPERLAAQGEHRDRAIADTYTMILRPVIDRLGASLPA